MEGGKKKKETLGEARPRRPGGREKRRAERTIQRKGGKKPHPSKPFEISKKGKKKERSAVAVADALGSIKGGRRKDLSRELEGERGGRKFRHVCWPGERRRGRQRLEQGSGASAPTKKKKEKKKGSRPLPSPRAQSRGKGRKRGAAVPHRKGEERRYLTRFPSFRQRKRKGGRKREKGEGCGHPLGGKRTAHQPAGPGESLLRERGPVVSPIACSIKKKKRKGGALLNHRSPVKGKRGEAAPVVRYLPKEREAGPMLVFPSLRSRKGRGEEGGEIGGEGRTGSHLLCVLRKKGEKTADVALRKEKKREKKKERERCRATS